MGTDNAAQHAAIPPRSHNIGGSFEGVSSILVAFGKLGPILRYQLGYTSRLSRNLIQASKRKAQTNTNTGAIAKTLSTKFCYRR